jgi:hypothetical protein
MARFVKGIWFLSAAIFMIASASLIAQQSPKRLILKDGSYQTVTKWEIVGDRVRYYSAERYGWEEVPGALVDWPATEKYNQESENERAALALRIAKGQAATDIDDAAGQPDTPMVAPGLRLPDGGGVFLLDTYQNQPQLLELAQNSGELNRHTGKNILRAAINPLALSSKQTIELKGEHAKMQSHLTQAAIYVNVDSADAASNSSHAQTPPGKEGGPPAEHYGIVRLEKKNGMRVVGNLNVAIYGKVSQKENWVKTTSTPVGAWVKIAPAAPLATGEYAVVELLEKGQINLYVWDFGVDPAAPANPNAWTPRQAGPDPTGKGPVLEKRPK